jgi:hypothetical protein
VIRTKSAPQSAWCKQITEQGCPRRWGVDYFLPISPRYHNFPDSSEPDFLIWTTKQRTLFEEIFSQVSQGQYLTSTVLHLQTKSWSTHMRMPYSMAGPDLSMEVLMTRVQATGRDCSSPQICHKARTIKSWDSGDDPKSVQVLSMRKWLRQGRRGTY